MSHPRIAWGLALVFLAGAPTWAGAAPGELWEVTTKMEMAGVPFQMPASTNQVCMQQGKQTEAMVPKQQDCRMMDVRQSGNRTTFRMVCEGANKVTGTGDIQTSPDSYQGTMRLQGTMDGKQMDMTQTFSGRRLGQCNYEAPAQASQATKQACQSLVDALNWGGITTEGAPCAGSKPALCRKVGALAQELRDPARLLAAEQRYGDNLRMAFDACGQNLDASLTTACQRAISARNWSFVETHCEADARRLAAERCQGRSYTAVMQSEWASICRRYPPTASTPVPAPAPAQAPVWQTGPAPQTAPAPVWQSGPAPQTAPVPVWQTGPAPQADSVMQPVPAAAPVADVQPAPASVPAQQAPQAPAPASKSADVFEKVDKVLDGLNKLKDLFGR